MPSKEELGESWKKMLDKYEIDHGGEIEDPQTSRARVQRILGDEGITKLYGGEEKLAKPKETQAREAFIDRLLEVLDDPDKDYKELDSNKGTRETNPNEHAVTMEDLLGKDVLDLFKKAVKEEAESTFFRDAVFLQATTNYRGPKWDERMVLWIGGPSSSGKTFSSKLVIKELQKNGILADPDPEKGNLKPWCNLTLQTTELTEEEKKKAKETETPILIKKGDQFSIYGFMDPEWTETPLSDLSQEDQDYLQTAFAGENKPVTKIEMEKELVALLKKGHTPDNRVVMIDGSIEREVMQMRQLVLQVALKKGYPGIRDLDTFTHYRIKEDVKEAALTNSDLSLCIQETFSGLVNPFQSFDVETFDMLEDTKQIFSEVIAAPIDEMDQETYELREKRFKDVVKRSGDERAYSSNFDEKHLDQMDIKMNNREIGCESKRYKQRGFDPGKLGSEKARKKYRAKSVDNIYVPIINDRLSVRLSDDGKDWVECDEKYQGKATVISERDWKRWKKFKLNNYIDPTLPDDHKLQGQESLVKWLAILAEKKQLSPPIIEVKAPGKVKKPKELMMSEQAPQPVEVYGKIGKEGQKKIQRAIKGDVGAISRIGCDIEIEEPLTKLARRICSSSHIEKLVKALIDENGDPIKKAIEKHPGEPFFKKNGQPVNWLKDFLPEGKTQSDLEGYYIIMSQQSPPIPDNQMQNWLIQFSAKEMFAASIRMVLAQHENEPVFNENGEPANWLNEILPPRCRTDFAIFFKEYYKIMSELTITPDEKIHPWLINFIGKDNLQELRENLNMDDNDLLPHLLGIARDALTQTLMEHQKEVNSLIPFMDFASPIMGKHQFFGQSHSTDTYELAQQRILDLDTERKILHLITEHREVILKEYPLSPGSFNFIELSKELDPHVKKMKNQKENRLIKEESIHSEDLLSETFEKTSRIFSPGQPAAELASSRPQALTNLKPSKHEIRLTQNNDTQLNATVKEHLTATGRHLASDLTRLDASLNVGKIFAKVAFSFVEHNETDDDEEEDDTPDDPSLHLFSSLAKAEIFFKKAPTYLRENFGCINREGLKAYLEEYSLANRLDDESFSALVETLFRAYKTTMEQPDSYTIKGGNFYEAPFDRDNYLPSDALIRLAKHHVDTYLRFCGPENDTQFMIAKECWDPHYIKAVMLYCNKMGFPPPQYPFQGQGGWEVKELTLEEKTAFEQLYDQKFKKLDKELDKKLEEQEAPQSPRLH